jgi:NADH dehydrogenase
MAALSPADIAELVRRMLRRFPSVEILLAEVTAIDTAEHCVTLGNNKCVSYDFLVLAAGATHAYFGHDDWADFAPSLKSIDDARRVRSRLLRSFKQAEMSDDAAERKRLMTFVVIGGGPSGVELAGAIAELARYTLAKDFHRINVRSTTVLLLEAGPRLLATFPEALATYARRKLESLGVTVRTDCAVIRLAPVGDGSHLPVGRIPAPNPGRDAVAVALSDLRSRGPVDCRAHWRACLQNN